MLRTQHRFMTAAATAAVALSLGAAPALAGSDGCEDECQQQGTPPPALPMTPVPVVPAPPQAVTPPAVQPPEAVVAPRRASKPPVRRAIHRHAIHRHPRVVRARPVVQPRPVVRTRLVARHLRVIGATTSAQARFPRGGVSAGAGGTAPDGPDVALIGLAVMLLATGGGLVAAARRSGT
jgi:hypothetical protein